jgi:hypothetical protein
LEHEEKEKTNSELADNHQATTVEFEKSPANGFVKSQQLTTGTVTPRPLAALLSAVDSITTVCETGTAKYVYRQVQQEQSQIIVIPDGGGKTKSIDYTYEQLEISEEDLDWEVFGDVPDKYILLHELWMIEGSPLPKQPINHFVTQSSWNRLICKVCHRGCKIIDIGTGRYSPWLFIKESDILHCLLGVSGKCPAKEDLAFSYLGELANLMIELPAGVEEDYLDMLRALNNNMRKIILLTPSDNLKKLRRAFPIFAVKQRSVPALSQQDFRNIYQQWLSDAKLSASPLPDEVFPSLTAISHNNGTEFKEIVRDLIEGFDDEGVTGTVSIKQVIQRLKPRIDLNLAVMLVLQNMVRHKKGIGPLWVDVRSVQKGLLTFGFITTPEKIGRLLSDLGLEDRRMSSGMQYCLEEGLIDGIPLDALVP